MSDQHPQHDPSHQPYGAPAQPPYQAPHQQSYQPGYQQPHHPAYAGPARPMSPEDERTWGALGHGAALAAMVLTAGFLGFLGSLAVYLLHKDRGPFVRAHSANSLNVQITMVIWMAILVIPYVVLGIVTVGFFFVVGWPIIFLPMLPAGILHLVGTIKAYNGEWWNPPLTPRFIR